MPKWQGNIYKDTGSGQQLVIPSSDEMSLIAKAPLYKMQCFQTTFAYGKFQLEVYEGSKVFDLIPASRLNEYCEKASDFCSHSMENVKHIQAYKGKNLFYVGVMMMFIISSLLTLIGLVYDFAWISVFSILLFVFGMGCCYEIINTRARKIHEILNAFIQLNDDFSNSGIDVKAGPYGTYIEFSLKSSKSIS